MAWHGHGIGVWRLRRSDRMALMLGRKIKAGFKDEGYHKHSIKYL
jgi:hypothetical protein